jgi:hypothetical protein
MLKRESKSIGDILSEYFEENPFLKTKIAEQRAVRAWSELLGSGVSSYTKKCLSKTKHTLCSTHVIGSASRTTNE